MFFHDKKIKEINQELDLVLELIAKYEHRYKLLMDKVHPKHTKSAKNFVHYLAIRSIDLVQFQKKLEAAGFYFYPASANAVLYYIFNLKSIINRMLQKREDNYNLTLTPAEARTIHKNNAIALFGLKKNNRKTSIMVTQPTIAATDKQFVKKLLHSGINCARINCAHDNKKVWEKIIENIKEENLDCKIMMDLAGPKLRTGVMKPQSRIIRIAPKKTSDKKKKIAKIWLIPSGKIHKVGQKANAIIQVNNKWLKKTQPGDYLTFIDVNGKKRKIEIVGIEGDGRWGVCYKSTYITTGTLINVFFNRAKNTEKHTFHEFYTLDNFISLKKDDFLKLTKDDIPGEPAIYSHKQELVEPAHISCTLPQIFDYVNIGEPIFFDDGKIEGIIKEKDDKGILIKIISPQKDKKLRENKGINLPKSKLKIEGLTQKDKEDLCFVIKHADTVNFSFVNNKQDVENLLSEIKKTKKSMGVVLKIETVEALKNLPTIILKAMENYPLGLMIARGDLAIEAGWKNFATIQEEILMLCEAAHIPDVWATQVLENMAKKGIPTRAEITDAAMSQQADCVMLNKGPYIEHTVKMLDKVLRNMEKIKKKKAIILPKLNFNGDI